MKIQEKIDKALQNHNIETYRGHTLKLSHDGFRKNGEPESDLYDLFVWDGDEIVIYHYENWFTSACATEQFFLIERYPSKEFWKNNFYGLHSQDFHKE